MAGRKSFNDMDNDERTDYCHLVYKELVAQNADPSLLPFPAGIDRSQFGQYPIQIRSRDGGFYNGPTIKALIDKVLTAHFAVYLDQKNTVS